MNRCLAAASGLLTIAATASAQPGPGRWTLVDTTALHADVVAPASLSLAAVVVFPLDRRLAQFVRQPALQESRALQGAAHVFDFWGGAGVFIASGGTWLAGAIADDDRARRFGESTGKALLAGTLVTGTLKIAFGRARPLASPDHHPRDFAFGRGLRDDRYRSLPSGHATAAFAFASAGARQLVRNGSGDGFDRPALYVAASLVALTRMYQDKHWASDVLLGAAIGTAAGMLVVR